MDYSKLYKSVEQSVVNVVQVTANNQCHSTATGAIIENGNKVLTCNHCIDKSYINGIYDKMTSKVLPGKIIFADDEHDVAILEFPNKIGTGLKIVSSRSLEIGNEVFTIGFPYYLGSDKTLTCGNIAAFENNLIKLNVTVNNGNSGGPLLNINGEVVGIVNQKMGGLNQYLASLKTNYKAGGVFISGMDPIKAIQNLVSEMERNLNLGIGYAIPSDTIASIAPLIKSIVG